MENELISEAKEFAQKLLLEFKEFLPFAMALKKGNEIVHIGIDTKESTKLGQKVFRELESIIQGKIFNNEIKIGIICFNGKVTDKSSQGKDAIVIYLYNGFERRQVIFPYDN